MHQQIVVLMFIQVVRCFEDNDIVHVNGRVDPKSDIDVINLELVFSDLDQVHIISFSPFLFFLRDSIST